MIGIHDSDLFWLAFIVAFVSGMALGWCLRDVRDAWGADSDGVARAFRDDVARYSEMMSPGVRCLAGG